MNSGVYKIKNTVNDKCYIGSAVSFKNRWSRHRNDLRKGRHRNSHLQSAWNKYDEESFVFEVIEEVLDKSSLIAKEQHYLDTLKPEYNMCLVAGSHLGIKRSEETRRKMSDIRKGISHRHSGRPLSEETRRKLGLSIKDWWFKRKAASLDICLQ